MPHYGKFDYARLGFFSLTTKETKFISEDDSLTIDGLTETPGYHFGQAMKGVWVAKRKANELELSYPFKAIPGKIPDALYIDIRHAFRQIASAFGLEVFVDEGSFVAYGETMADAPCFQDKICRGLLVTGTSQRGSYQEWINRDIRTVEFSNPSYAPHIRNAIWSTLHAIQTRLSPLTLYAHTDGFIVRSRHAERAFRVLDECRFNYTVKGSGVGEIFGVGNYRIGGHRTSTPNRVYTARTSIREDNSDWWLEAFRKGVEARSRFKPSEWYDGLTEGG